MPSRRPWVRISRTRELAPVTETTMLATDIIGFAGSYRDAPAQLHARQLMYDLLITAFEITGLPWWDCYHEDRGDGALIIAPSGISPVQFLAPLTHHLDALMRWDKERSGSAQLRLRIAVHHGYVYRDEYGVTGHALTHLFRILEAPAFKKAIATAGTHLGAIISDQLYADALQRGGLINLAAYTQLRLTCKETRTQGWLWLPSRP